MKEIIIVANSTHGGGAENSMMLLHSEFNNSGFKSTYFALNRMNDGLDRDDPDVLHIGRSWSDGLSKTLKYLKVFKENLNFREPNVIVVNCELPELFLAISKIGTAKIVIVEHTSQPWAGRRWLGVFVRVILKFKSVTWVTVNSQALRVWPFFSSATYIPNPISRVKQGTLVTKAGSGVFVGRLRKEKCPGMAIQASIDAGVPINVIGDGNLAESLIVQYGKFDSVKFLGYLNNPWACISPESIVVVPSEYEGDGIVVLEALQNGNPILLRDIADLRRFNLNDENYFKNQNQLTSKLKEYRANPSLFTIPNSEQDRILGNRDIRAIKKQWSVLIDELFEDER